MPFSSTFVLLQNEAFLAQGNLSAGLTALRTAKFPNKGDFYTGFFNTSIALERIMKLIVITEHMISNAGEAPTKNELKNYGHDLMSLFTTCINIGKRYNWQVNSYEPHSIENEILMFLSEFAKQSRYYNLDSLKITPKGYADPLTSWDTILRKILTEDVDEKLVEKKLRSASIICELMSDGIHAIQHGMSGSLLTHLGIFQTPVIHDLAAPQTMVEFLTYLPRY